MRILTPKFSVLCALFLLFTCPYQAFASEEPEEVVIERLKPVFDHLLSLTDHKNQARFDFKQIAPLLEFVASSKNPDNKYNLGSRSGGSSAYYEFTVKRSLKEVLNLAYNPEIPSYVITPSSIRLAQWLEIDGKRQPFPKLSDAIKNLSKPMIVRGTEFIENTPDANSGAYYSYQLNRTLILLQYQGQPVLLSVSNQKDKSDVGKKGLVLGSDENWNYLYTGEKGCTKKGLTWADSYMYSSSAIIVYFQTNDPVPKVKCATFKWLKAGWAGINLVQPFHIRKGIERFAKTYKAILESPAVTDVAKIAHMYGQIEMLSTEELRHRSHLYFDHLAQRYKDDNKLAREWLGKISKDESYIANMSREEMKAIVSVQYLKHLLGKDQPFDLGFFFPSKTLAQRSD